MTKTSIITITAFLSVGLTYILSKPFGLLGASIGCTFFELVMAFYVLPDSFRMLGMKATDLFLNIRDDLRVILLKFKR